MAEALFVTGTFWVRGALGTLGPGECVAKAPMKRPAGGWRPPPSPSTSLCQGHRVTGQQVPPVRVFARTACSWPSRRLGPCCALNGCRGPCPPALYFSRPTWGLGGLSSHMLLGGFPISLRGP